MARTPRTSPRTSSRSRSASPRVAVVTGASRGGGRGIARVLGEHGWTVYVTGRSVRGAPLARAAEVAPGLTIDDAADEVTARGGRGIAVRCDHRSDADVAALFARVREEQGALDLLVNNAWGGYEQHPDGLGMHGSLALPPAETWDEMFVAGVRAHLVATHHAVPLMVPRRRRGAGLVVNTVAWTYDVYLQHLYYDVAKAAIIRMAFALAHELVEQRVAAIALAPGFMRSEAVMAAHARHPFDLSATESVEYLGRAVAALAADPDVMRHTGRVHTVGDLARVYGFTDVDGRQPAAFRMPDEMIERQRRAFRAAGVEAPELVGPGAGDDAGAGATPSASAPAPTARRARAPRAPRASADS